MQPWVYRGAWVGHHVGGAVGDVVEDRVAHDERVRWAAAHLVSLQAARQGG